MSAEVGGWSAEVGGWSADPFVGLGQALNATEASGLADWLAEGASLGKALQVLSAERRAVVRSLLVDAGLDGAGAVGVLRAIAGAHSQTRTVEPIWTVPHGLATAGHLTSSLEHLVTGARESVVCSTYNFQRSSALWDALSAVAARGTVAVTVYLDTKAATSGPAPEEVVRHLAGAEVFRTRMIDGRPVRNHAKAIVIDHQVLVATSANFSASAEKHNVEFGLVVRDPALADNVEAQLRRLQPLIYEHVKGV